MGAANTNIIDLFLCLFLLANFCHPFFSKFRLFLLQWNSMKFSRVLFQSPVRVTKCAADIWHVLILNPKMKLAQNWDLLNSWFFAKQYLFFCLPHTCACARWPQNQNNRNGSVRNYWQTTFVTLIRCCPFSSTTHYSPLFLIDNIRLDGIPTKIK